jgi:hypothetical protein
MSMYTKTFLAVGLALAMTSMQACFYSGPDHWGGQGYTSNDPQYRYNSNGYNSNHTVCDSNGNHCTVCDDDNDNCQRTTAGTSWFIW